MKCCLCTKEVYTFVCHYLVPPSCYGYLIYCNIKVLVEFDLKVISLLALL